jgi:hypothetical protein
VSVCYLGAVAAPGVAIVWSLCGSSMAYIIAFILPAACYIRVMHIRRVQLETESETTTTTPPGSAAAAWTVWSWILLLFSVVCAMACTTQTIYTMFFFSSSKEAS